MEKSSDRLVHTSRLHQARTWVADAWCACVTQIHHLLPLLQTHNQLLGGLSFVVLMHRKPLGLRQRQTPLTQHLLAVSCVLTGEHIGLLQQGQTSQADVGQVANGGGQHVEAPLRMVLSFAGMTRSVQRIVVSGIQWQPFQIKPDQ